MGHVLQYASGRGQFAADLAQSGADVVQEAAADNSGGLVVGAGLLLQGVERDHFGEVSTRLELAVGMYRALAFDFVSPMLR